MSWQRAAEWAPLPLRLVLGPGLAYHGGIKLFADGGHANISHLMEPLMATAEVTGELLGTPNEKMRALLGEAISDPLAHRQLVVRETLGARGPCTALPLRGFSAKASMGCPPYHARKCSIR